MTWTRFGIVFGTPVGGIDLFYRHSGIKQYLKDGRVMRIETVINSPRDLGCNAACPTSTNSRSEPVPAINGSCMLNGSARSVLASPAFERIAYVVPS